MPAEKILEKDVEGYLRDEVRSQGWDIHKNISDPVKGGTPGFPDDTIILPYPTVLFVECKQPKTLVPYLKKRERFFETGDTTGCSKTEVRQFREQQRIERKGHDVYVIGTYDDVDKYIKLWETLYG